MKPTPDEFARHKQETLTPAREVLEHVHRAVLAAPEFTLKEGTKALIEEFFPPELNDDGELACGFDVILDNGTQLEFTMRNTGWGKSFVAAQTTRKAKQGRKR